MKRRELVIVLAVALISALFSFVLADAIFGSPKKNPIKVPVVEPIKSDFPDVNNDSTYSSFLNSKALDPTQLIKIGNNKNTAPFQGGGQ